MSVLIKGFKTPQNCASCPLYVMGLMHPGGGLFGGCVLLNYKIFGMGNPDRPSECPLVEIKGDKYE